MSGAWFKQKSAFWRMINSSSNGRDFQAAERIVDVVLAESFQRIIAATWTKFFWIDVKTMTAVREIVLRDKNGSDSEISTICICESEGILVVALFLFFSLFFVSPTYTVLSSTHSTQKKSSTVGSSNGTMQDMV